MCRMFCALCLALILGPQNAASQVITFEQLPDGTPTADMQPISYEYAAYGVRFALVTIGTTCLAGPAYIAKEGAPTTAFVGCQDEEDTPLPGQNVGSSFLSVRRDELGPAYDLLVEYFTPVAEPSGVIVDVDSNCEQWTLLAMDAYGQILETIIIDPPNTNNGCIRDPGDSIAAPWMFHRANPDISSILFRFSGNCPNTHYSAFDNFAGMNPTTSVPGNGSWPPDRDTPASSPTIGQNAPNPFNPATEIRFTIPRTGVVGLRIFDAEGRLVRTLIHNRVEAGDHVVRWDGRADRGEALPSGVYYYEIVTDSGRESRKAVLLR